MRNKKTTILKSKKNHKKHTHRTRSDKEKKYAGKHVPSFGVGYYISNTNMSSGSSQLGSKDRISSSSDSSSSSDVLGVMNCALSWSHFREPGIAIGAEETLAVVGERLRL